MTIDYLGLADAVAAILQEEIEEVTIEVEQEMNFAPEQSPWIGVYVNGRRPSAVQGLRAGRQLRYDIDMSIIVMAFALDRRSSIRIRDDTIGRVEVAMMGNRTIGDLVEMTLLQGGELTAARTEGDIEGFVAAGEILLTAVSAIVIEV